MTDISVQVEWKLPQLPRKTSLLTFAAGTTVRDLLRVCVPHIDEHEVMVIINGRSALLEDMTPDGGTIFLLPVLCGG